MKVAAATVVTDSPTVAVTDGAAASVPAETAYATTAVAFTVTAAVTAATCP